MIDFQNAAAEKSAAAFCLSRRPGLSGATAAGQDPDVFLATAYFCLCSLYAPAALLPRSRCA